ncbi:MAG: TolC family protein [Gemmatimonadaceae bacterium]
MRPALALAVLAASAAAAQPPQRPGGAPDEPPIALHDVLVRAVAQSPLVEAARSRVRAAEGARITARAFGNPILTYQVENAPFPGGHAPAGMDAERSAFATLPLEPLFQRRPRARRAEEDVRAARAELDLARRVVALDAARAYYRLALAQAAVEGATDVRDRLDELGAYTESRVKEGVTSEGDLIRVQVEQDRAEADLALASVELARARGELAPYLGAPVVAAGLGAVRVADTSAVPVQGFGAAGTALAPLADYLARARTSRPDLVAARARVAAGRAETGYQRSLAVRQLGATLGAKRIAGESSMIAGLSLPLPIFDQNRGEVQRASAERAAAEQELAWRERQVAAEVAAAHEAARLLVARRGGRAGSVVARAEEARRIALAAYREGAVSLLQVIDASRTLGEARLSYYRTLFAERESLLELNVVTGGELLAPPAIPSTASADATTDARPAAGRVGGLP